MARVDRKDKSGWLGAGHRCVDLAGLALQGLVLQLLPWDRPLAWDRVAQVEAGQAQGVWVGW